MIEESFHVERLFVFEHEIDGPAKLVGKDAQRLALVVFVGQLGDVILGLMRIPEHEDRGLLDGPFEMMVADLFIAVSGPFAVRFFDRPDQPGVRGKILYPGKAGDIVNFIQDDQGQDLPDTRDRAQQVQGVVIVLPGGFFDIPFELLEDLIHGIDHGQVDFDALSDGRIAKPLGNPVVVVFTGQLFPERR